jgi:Mg-chelatase subunit ChlD
MRILILTLFSALLLLSGPLHADDDPTLRRNVVVVFDDSGSMAGFFDSKLKRAQKATSEFINKLPDRYNLGIYALNSGYIFPLQPLNAAKRQQLVKRLYTLRARGSTPIGKALAAMSEELHKQQKEQAGYGSYTIVIATDGIADDPQRMFKEVDRAIERGITIKTIGIDIRRHGLRQVTDFTEASSAQQLASAMKRAVDAEVTFTGGFVPQDF